MANPILKPNILPLFKMLRSRPVAKQVSHLSGILVVDKPGLVLPAGQEEDQAEASHLPTSHDIVQRVRRWSGQRRIGHTGTLDPMASGVLVLCLGQATRLVEYYQGHDKQYYAEVALGSATDTYDALGKVVAQDAVPPLTPAKVEQTLAQFRGTIQQQPPVYSALKQGGEAAHRRARRGETVDLPLRTVTFHKLDLVELLAPDRIALRAHCSAGTYIRSLAHDLGEALGTPAHLAALRRESAGGFTLNDAHSLAHVEQAGRANQLDALLLAPGVGLELPTVTVDDEQARRFGFGQQVVLNSPAEPAEVDSLAQAYHQEGHFLGIIRQISSDAGLWKAEKWFMSESEAANQGA
jgi:tRNA pseudouridine55 synthase